MILLHPLLVQPLNKPLEIRVRGPSTIIKEAMRLKNRHLWLNSRQPVAASIGVGRAAHGPTGPVTQMGTTIVSQDSPGGVPESELGSIPTQKLPGAIFHFASEFELPEGTSIDFDIAERPVVDVTGKETGATEEREIVDLAMFRCKALRTDSAPITVAIAICDDVRLSKLIG